MRYEVWVISMTTMALSLVLCLLLAPIARRIDLLDHPSERKVHQSSIPLTGGPAIFLAMLLSAWLFTEFGAMVVPLLVVCFLMLVTGLLDDLHELSPLTRFIFQILACCVMIFFSDVVLRDFGSLMWNGVLSLGWVSVPMTIFAALGVINAFNMMDGIDGLSSVIFMIAATAMAWLALRAGFVVNTAVLMITVAAVFGFFLLNARLPWNKSGRVFLGDSGSLFLGMLLAWQFIDLGNGDDRAFAPMTAVWLMAVPLADTLRLMSERWLRGGSSMQADHFHLHHAFLKAGFTVNQTLAAIILLVLFTTGIGVAGHIFAWPEYLMFYTYMVCGWIYFYIMRRCWRDGRFLGREVNKELK